MTDKLFRGDIFLIHSQLIEFYLFTKTSRNWHNGGKFPQITLSFLYNFFKKYSFFGSTFGLRVGDPRPNLLNKNLVFNFKIKKIALGASFLLCLTGNQIVFSEIKFIFLENGVVFGLGDNYKGQLGNITHNYNHNFERLTLDSKETIVDMAAGLQHSVLLSSQTIIQIHSLFINLFKQRMDIVSLQEEQIILKF